MFVYWYALFIFWPWDLGTRGILPVGHFNSDHSGSAVFYNWAQNTRVIWEFHLSSPWLQGSRELELPGFFLFLTVVNYSCGFWGSTTSFEFVLLTSILWLVVFSCIWSRCSLNPFELCTSCNRLQLMALLVFSRHILLYSCYLLSEVAQTTIQWGVMLPKALEFKKTKQTKSFVRIKGSFYTLKNCKWQL